MDAKKEKVLAAMLSYPTKELAAKAAGVSSKTINRYLRDAEFAEAYDLLRNLRGNLPHSLNCNLGYNLWNNLKLPSFYIQIFFDDLSML